MRKDKAIRFLRHGINFANEFSKDRSTKVAATFIDPTDFTELAKGYNGFPRGALDDLPERHERPLKYEYSEHAERNGIFNIARRNFLRNTVVVTTEELTMSSARAIIAVGAKEVYSLRPHSPTDQHHRAIALLHETHVSAGYHDGKRMEAPDQSGYVRKLEGYLDDAWSLVRNHAKDPYAGGTSFLAAHDLTPVVSGYSGMPRGADDTRMERYEGAERLHWVEDSIRNSIYNVARRLLKGSVAVVTEEPCSECFRGCAAVGSIQVIAPEPKPEFAERWGDALRRTREMAEELKVELTSIPRSALLDLPAAGDHTHCGCH
jgi:deoxycytidylate deaminase